MFYSQNKAAATSFPSGFALVASSPTGCWISSGGTTHCSYGLHGTVTAGHLAVVHVWWPDTGTITATFSCTNNGSFTALGSKKTGVGTLSGHSGQMFYKVLTSTGADTCTPTFSTNVTTGGWLMVRYSFTGSISGTDGTAVYSTTAASGTTATISGLTTSSTTGVLISNCIGVDSSCTATAGWTSRNDTASCNNFDGTSCSTTNGNYNTTIGGLIEDKFNASSGAQSATFTTGSGDNVILGLVAF